MKEIPSCDSSETLKGLELRIKNLPEAQKNNVQFIGIKNASQQRFDEQQGVRECSATLITSGGEQLIPYTLSFPDQQNTVKPNDFSTSWIYFGAALLFCAAWILIWRAVKKTQAHKKNQTPPLQSKEPKQTMKNFELLMAFIAATLNKMPEDWGKPRELSGMEVVEALWPLNDMFRPHLSAIGALPYAPALEAEADQAIENFIRGDGGAAWDNLPPAVWRVLLERHTQALVVASANEAAGNPLMTIPEDLPEHAWLCAAMLYLMYQMRLPYKVKSRLPDEFPPAGSPARSVLH